MFIDFRGAVEWQPLIVVSVATAAMAIGVALGRLMRGRDTPKRAPATTSSIPGDANDERFRLLLENVTDYAIAMLDPFGRVVSWNEGAERITGYNKSDIVGKPVSILFPPENEVPLPDLLARAVETGRVELEGARVRQDGSRFNVAVTMTPILDESGSVRAFALVTHDITSRVQLEHARQELLEILRDKATDWTATFDAVNVPILLLDAEGEIRRMNRAAQRLADKPFTDLIHRPVRELSGEPWQTIAEVGRETFEHSTVESVRVTGGDAVWQVSSSVGSTYAGDPRAIVVAYDLTRVARLESALRENEVAAALGAMVAGVAHEVRNPLFTISATLDAWQARYGSGDGMARYAGTLHEQVDRLNRLMTDLLDYAKPHTLALATVSLADVVHAAAADCAPLAAQQSVEILLSVRDDLPPLHADSVRLEQVFQNVIDNAIRHSPAGASVLVETAIDPDGVTVRVVDEGQDATADDIARAFVPFFSRRRGGTGLGLPIARKLVTAHGGEITLQQRDGQRGTVATIRLPYAFRDIASSAVVHVSV